MDDVKWERCGAQGGVAFVVLAAASGVLGGQPPSANDPAGDIVEYLDGNKTSLQAGLWLLGFGVIALTMWFASLWRRMERAESGAPWLAVVSLVGLAMVAPLALLSSAIWATTAMRIEQVGEDAAFYYTLGSVVLAVEGFGLATHLLATNLLGIRARMLPLWIVVLGFASALAFLVTAVLGASDTDVNGSVGLVAFVLWLVWIVGVSACIWRDAAVAIPREST